MKSEEGAYFTYQTRVYLRREKEVDDFDKSFFLFRSVDSLDVGYAYTFDFVTNAFDQDEQVVVENCIVDWTDQFYCTRKLVLVTANKEFDVFTNPVCQNTTDLNTIAFCQNNIDQEIKAAQPNNKTGRVLRAARRSLQATQSQSKELALKFFASLANTTITPTNIATFLTTLRKTISSYFDATVYPSIKNLLLSAVPYVNSPTLMSEINGIIDTLSANKTIVTAREGNVLKLISSSCFSSMVREKIDFATRSLEN